MQNKIILLDALKEGTVIVSELFKNADKIPIEEVTDYNVKEFKEGITDKFNSLKEAGIQKIIIDLSVLTYINSSGLSVLWMLARDNGAIKNRSNKKNKLIINTPIEIIFKINSRLEYFFILSGLNSHRHLNCRP